ncbi:hypothetical protein [Halorubrum sp. DTA46]|uniref:hypothetical protein n=1 Tax=Halorubrum sp. DTA46 TaxID=3402162 RepID=UPI003AAF5076
MDRRRFLTGTGTAVAVGIAGCAGAGSDRPFDDADWRDGDGLDLTVLAERHTEALVDAGGVTLFSTAETDHDGEEQPNPWLPSQEYESGYDLENERQYVRQEIPDDGEPEVSELFIADDEALFRQRIGDRVQYDRQPINLTGDQLAETMRSEVVTGIRVEGETAAGETEYEGLNLWNPTSDGEGSVRGEPTARFVSDAFDGDRTIPSTIETASATAHVFESGIVPRLTQSWEGDHDGQVVTVDIGIDYRDPGAEISEPEWLADAREATGAEGD